MPRQQATTVTAGTRFGRLTVLGASRSGYVLVRCDCGKERNVYRYDLLKGATRSCGCARFKLPCSAGSRFGRLVVMGDAPQGPNSRRYVWVKCDCGTVKKAQPARLLSGETVSCGCYTRVRSTTHGMSHRHPIYTAWQNMRARCTNPNRVEFKNYGGRGIKVCERWQKFESFRDDMVPSWQMGLRLGRIDNNGDYEPGNCRWGTRARTKRQPPLVSG